MASCEKETGKAKESWRDQGRAGHLADSCIYGCIHLMEHIIVVEGVETMEIFTGGERIS